MLDVSKLTLLCTMLSITASLSCKSYSKNEQSNVSGDLLAYPDTPQRIEQALGHFRLCDHNLTHLRDQKDCFPFHPSPDKSQANYQSLLLENAAVLAHLAMIAYRGDEFVTQWARKVGLIAALYFDVGSTQAFLFVHPSFNILAFRGSEAIAQDWFTNIKSFINPLAMPGMHQGFRKAFEHIEATTTSLFRQDGKERDMPTLANATTPLWTTGHSLGGALAVAASIKFSRKFERKIEGVMTFGAPRVLNWRTSVAFGTGSYANHQIRFVYGEDIITTVPGRGIGFGHFDPTGYIERDSCRLTVKGAVSEKEKGLLNRMATNVSEGLKELFKPDNMKSLMNLCSIKDHCIINYVACLSKEQT